MNQTIVVKLDKRFKDGNIKVEGNVLRGNPKTLTITPAKELPQISREMLADLYKKAPNFYLNYLSHQLRQPPLVVSKELAKKIKEVL